jgi:hypothetical protein
MLAFLRGKVSNRKLRLLAVACCRGMWQLLSDQRSRQAVEVAERVADGLAGSQNLASARGELTAHVRRRLRAVVLNTARSEGARADAAETKGVAWAGAWDAACYAVRAVAVDAANLAVSAVSVVQKWGKVTLAGQATPERLLRCIFGNPAQSLPVLETAWLAWNGNTVKKLADSIYEERAFDCLPILADALEEAGCNDADILQRVESLRCAGYAAISASVSWDAC